MQNTADDATYNMSAEKARPFPFLATLLLMEKRGRFPTPPEDRRRFVLFRQMEREI